MRLVGAAACAVVALLLGACSAVSGPAPRGATIDVVAAESTWGGIVAELGGERVSVTSLVSRPGTDPHDYEPTAGDARALAAAHYVVVNGLGYDAWATDAIDANPARGRVVLDVGRALGLHDGDNPHRWYFPADVARVVARVAADLEGLDPGGAAYYEAQRRAFEAGGLARYHDLLAEIRSRFAGAPVAASESLFVGLAQATGLDLRTPPAFLDAISQGAGPSADAKATADDQITGRQVEVLVVNDQSSSPDVQALVDEAGAARIPVVSMSETPPQGRGFADWQADQLQALLDALAAAAAR